MSLYFRSAVMVSINVEQGVKTWIFLQIYVWAFSMSSSLASGLKTGYLLRASAIK